MYFDELDSSSPPSLPQKLDYVLILEQHQVSSGRVRFLQRENRIPVRE